MSGDGQGRSAACGSVFLVSLAALTLELTLTRLFSATMFYHFAFLAISLALFGSGASGVFVYLARRKRPLADPRRSFARAAILFAVTTVLALVIVLRNPLPLEVVPELFKRLVFVYAGVTLPFFFAGCAITVAITAWTADINRLYLFDLTGAAAGCLLVIPALDTLGAVDTVLAVAVIAAVSGAVAAGPTRRGHAAAALLLGVALLGLVAGNRSSRWLELAEAKGRPQDQVLFSKWNSFSRVTVEGTLEKPVLEMLIDADAATAIWRGTADDHPRPGQSPGPIAAVYHLRPHGDVLIIGPGGGTDVLAALEAGASRITGVEVNPIIVRDVMLREPFDSYSGSLYRRPGVHIVVDEGRSYVRSSSQRYDVIQGTLVDTWAATGAGAFALTENYLYTVEAFQDYLGHLADDGILCLTRWYFRPPDQMLRLVTVARAAMDEIGLAEPERHFMLFVEDAQTPDHTPGTLLLKRSPFTDEEVLTVERLAQRRGYGLLYTPRTRPANLFTRLVEARDVGAIARAYPTNIMPTRDNDPFFFNSLRPEDVGPAMATRTEWAKTNLGTAVLFALVGISAFGVALFILGPLALAGERISTGRRLAAVLYFACLGGGFIVVEVVLLQRFVLFLGHPVYALTVVLFSLLTSCGIGSLLAGRFDPARLGPALTRVLLLVAGFVVVYVFALAPLFYRLIHLPRPLRIAIAVAALAPLGTVMGMAMPTGLRMLDQRMPSLVPWAWGVNGAASVLGSVAALLIALASGFDQALLVGAGLYLAAVAFARAM
jgi:predicted membrane-bound spermidine synthase